MSCGEKVDITGCRNVSVDLLFKLTQSGGSPYSLSGHEVYAQSRKMGELFLDFDPQISGDGTSGYITIDISGETLSGLEIGTYDWDMVIKDTSDGTKIKPIYGKFYLRDTQTLQ